MLEVISVFGDVLCRAMGRWTDDLVMDRINKTTQCAHESAAATPTTMQ